MQISRRFFLGALAASTAGQALSDAPLTSLRPPARPGGVLVPSVRSADDLIAAARLEGKIGFVVADARTGQVLESRSPLLALPPASVAKSITALYALDVLGADHRFRTRLVGTGKLSNGRLAGDLILIGGGDPTLDTDVLGDMARELKAKGVREITGRFLVQSDVLPRIWSIDPSQPDHLGYNPTISGLNLNYNRVHFEWKRNASGYSLKMDAPAQKYNPAVAIARMRVVDRAQPIYTYSDTGGVDQWTVARPALGNGGSRWLPVRKPELYAADVFKTLARSHGIQLPAARIAQGSVGGTVLVERVSPELMRVLRDMLRWSTNLTAEVVGLTSTAERGGRPASLQSSAGAMSRWMRNRYGTRKAEFVDHSGLSDRSRISAADMVGALVKVGPNSALRGILKPILMRDANGKVMKNHPISVQAKTGTLNFVSALAGYMTAVDGTELAFAFFSADVARREAIARSDREVPQGARAWAGRSRKLQQRLIERWGTLYGA